MKIVRHFVYGLPVKEVTVYFDDDQQIVFRNCSCCRVFCVGRVTLKQGPTRLAEYIDHDFFSKESDKLAIGTGKELGRKWQAAYKYFEALRKVHGATTPVGSSWLIISGTLKIADRLVRTSK